MSPYRVSPAAQLLFSQDNFHRTSAPRTPAAEQQPKFGTTAHVPNETPREVDVVAPLLVFVYPSRIGTSPPGLTKQ